MNEVRVGIIGVGMMGREHARSIQTGRVPRARLTALHDPMTAEFPEFEGVTAYQKSEDLIRSGEVDAVIIATPHPAHTTVGIDALENGLHVMVEKPLSAHKAEGERLLAAHTDPNLQFGIMLNQRTDPRYQAIRRMVQSGELGAIQRIQWTITDWFRTNAYYASGGWRATWAGEGGGVLLNQCVHNLDLFQWMFGMPSTVRGFCQMGRYHPIEVEDDVTAFFEYPGGATAVLITSTGEAPGANRLEVAGDNGRVVLERGELFFTRNHIPASEFVRTSPIGMSVPPKDETHTVFANGGAQHAGILANWIEAILDGAPLLAPAQDGLNSLELANAIPYSSITGQKVELPMDSRAYADHLNGLIAASGAGQ